MVSYYALGRNRRSLHVVVLFITLLFVSAANADSLVAITTAGDLYTVNSSNAALTLIGSSGISNVGGLEQAPNGNLYGFTFGTDSKLYSFNPNTAAASLVGPLNLPWVVEGGLTFGPDGTAYGASAGNVVNSVAPYLFTLDLNTGAATFLSPLMGSLSYYDISGLAYRPDGMLVGLQDNTTLGNSVVLINPNTGAVTTLGTFPFVYTPISGLAILDGTGYFTTGKNSTNSLYSFDPYTGNYSTIGSLGGLSISGLATVSTPSVPEPASLVLFGSGLAGFVGVIRRKLNR